MNQPNRPGHARCPCGHLWLHHDIDEHPGDNSELCCIEGCNQTECPGRGVTGDTLTGPERSQQRDTS